MTDVIGRQQKSTRAVCILSANHANTRDTAKHESHQQLASVIDGGFHVYVSSVSQLVPDRKVIFFRVIEFLNVVLCCRFQISCRSQSMKPRSPSTGGKGRFPQTDYFFHSGFGQWHGHFWSSDGEDRSRFRNLFNLGREYRIEAARERAREMAAFAVIVLTSAWPVVYMIVTVVKLLSKGRPLN
jgi:hypothetical protein